jgi:hypothetical protein
MVTETVRRWIQTLRTAMAPLADEAAAPVQQRSDRLELLAPQPILFSITTDHSLILSPAGAAVNSLGCEPQVIGERND